MGYYSEVAFATRQKTYMKMLKEAKHNEKILNFITNRGTYVSRIGEGDDAVVILEWFSVKWYDDFDEVKFIEEWMRRGDCELDDIQYSFVRLGEDYEDIEVRNSPDYQLDCYIYPQHSIYVDGNAESYTPKIPEDDESEEDLTESEPEDGEDAMRGFLFGG